MNAYRRKAARTVRFTAAELASSRPHPLHVVTGEEQKFRKLEKDIKTDKPSYLASFTKGMPHDYETGLLDKAENFASFVTDIDSGDPRDFRDTRLGPASAHELTNYNEPKKIPWHSDKA